MNLSLRQAGLLHRARRATVSTPLPSWSYMAALPPSEPLVSIIIELVRSLRHGAGVSVGSVCDARRFLNVVEIRALPRDPAPCPRWTSPRHGSRWATALYRGSVVRADSLTHVVLMTARDPAGRVPRYAI